MTRSIFLISLFQITHLPVVQSSKCRHAYRGVVALWTAIGRMEDRIGTLEAGDYRALSVIAASVVLNI